MSLQNSHQISDVKVMLVKGADGNGIVDISLTGQSGIVDTYTITLSNGDKYTFTVTNGNGIDRIEKTATHGLVDTYTIYFDNGDTETFDVTNGMGGGMSARLLINSDAGSTVTVTTPSGTVLTAEQVTGSTTQWYCDTVEYGVHTIDAVLGGDDAQVTVTVDSCKVYNIDDTHFHVTITVTYPDGATCRCQGGSESYYADGSPYTFSVHSADTYTITVVYDGQTYTGQVEVTISGTSFNITVPAVEDAPTDDFNLWLMYGGVSGSYSSLADVLADSSALATLMASQDAVDYLVRCTEWAGIGLVPVMTSDTTPSGVCSAYPVQTGYDAYKAFDGDESTFWASGARSGWIQYEFPTPKIVNKVSWLDSTTTQRTGTFKIQASNDGFVSETVDLYSGTATGISGEASFSNSTAYKYYRFLHVTPLDNVSFKTLQFYSENICDNSSAMSYIGLNNYASNTLLADSDWRDAICNSTYFESVLNVKVPTMTSNTTPSGECFASSQNTNNPPWKAFDGTTNEVWLSASGTTSATIGYGFETAKKIALFKIYPYGNGYSPKNCSIQYSTDNSTWQTVDSLTCPDTQEWSSHPLSSINDARYWRLNVANVHSKSYIAIREMQFYGREDV